MQRISTLTTLKIAQSCLVALVALEVHEGMQEVFLNINIQNYTNINAAWIYVNVLSRI